MIHSDLFPDNVLMLGERVTGLIDFYFACHDMMAYDLAVTHAAWSFADGGRTYRPDTGTALMAGYQSVRPLLDAESRALPLLAQGAALRFVSSRAQDWIDTPADALVTRKDPMDFYAAAGILSARRGGAVYRMKQVEIFTDGACKGNPGPGGWGALLRMGKHEKELSGGEPDTTNNRMEMTAAIRALQRLIEPCEVTLHTDSRYLIDGMTKWIDGWKRNGWISASKKPVRNDDLWHD